MASFAGEGRDRQEYRVPASRGPGAQVAMWVVVGEFAPACAGHLGPEDLDAIIDRLDAWHPAGLWDSERYAIQLRVPAESPHQAVGRALAYHQEAERAAGLASATLVRVEVLSVEELERAWGEDHLSGGGDATMYAHHGLLCQQVHTATRRLMAAATPADVAATLVAFVDAVGGTVEPGGPRFRPGTVDIELRIDGANKSHATAEALSVAGLIMESALPTLLSDARLVLARLQQNQHQG